MDVQSIVANARPALIFTGVPALLFVMDLLIKNGFGLSLDTAGGDLALVAIGVDFSFTSSVVGGSVTLKDAAILTGIVVAAHLVTWVSALRLVSGRPESWFGLARLAISYVVGAFAMTSSLLFVENGVTR